MIIINPLLLVDYAIIKRIFRCYDSVLMNNIIYIGSLITLTTLAFIHSNFNITINTGKEMLNFTFFDLAKL